MKKRSEYILKVKKFVEYELFPVYFPLHLGINVLRQFRIMRWLAPYRLPSVKHFPYLNYRKSDTLFIMGSGGSICTYTKKMWDTIRSHDSFAFNFWPVHDFIPTYYQVEIAQASVDRAAMNAKVLNHRKDAYANVPILLKSMHIVPERLVAFFSRLDPSLRKNMYVSFVLPMPGLGPRSRSYAIKWLERAGVYEENKPRKISFCWASSVVSMLNLAVHWGYRKLVLCGVDLTDSRYFYEVDADYYIKQNVPLPDNIFNAAETHHINTAERLLDDSPDWGSVKLKATLQILDEVVLKPRGIHMHVALKSSALYPDIPDYFR